VSYTRSCNPYFPLEAFNYERMPVGVSGAKAGERGCGSSAIISISTLKLKKYYSVSCL
jgi:hypothetical protein